MSKSKGPQLRVRLVHLDYDLCQPSPELDALRSRLYPNTKEDDRRALKRTQIRRVPVIHVFGSTELRQKCCLHIHRVMPYFFVRIPRAIIRHFEFVPEKLSHRVKVTHSIRNNSCLNCKRQCSNTNKKSTHWQSSTLLNGGLLNDFARFFGELIEFTLRTFGMIHNNQQHSTAILYDCTVHFGRDFYGYHDYKAYSVPVAYLCSNGDIINDDDDSDDLKVTESDRYFKVECHTGQPFLKLTVVNPRHCKVIVELLKTRVSEMIQLCQSLSEIHMHQSDDDDHHHSASVIRMNEGPASIVRCMTGFPLFIRLFRDDEICRELCTIPLSVYESHIPYLLQFLVDYNLFGMDFINLRPPFTFRQPLPSIHRMTHADRLSFESHCYYPKDLIHTVKHSYSLRNNHNNQIIDDVEDLVPDSPALRTLLQFNEHSSHHSSSHHRIRKMRKQKQKQWKKKTSYYYDQSSGSVSNQNGNTMKIPMDVLGVSVKFAKETVPVGMVSSLTHFGRRTVCELEVDCVAQSSIVNRQVMMDKGIMHDLKEAPIEKLKVVPSLAGVFEWDQKRLDKEFEMGWINEIEKFRQTEMNHGCTQRIKEGRLPRSRIDKRQMNVVHRLFENARAQLKAMESKSESESSVQIKTDNIDDSSVDLGFVNLTESSVEQSQQQSVVIESSQEDQSISVTVPATPLKSSDVSVSNSVKGKEKDGWSNLSVDDLDLLMDLDGPLATPKHIVNEEVSSLVKRDPPDTTTTSGVLLFTPQTKRVTFDDSEILNHDNDNDDDSDDDDDPMDVSDEDVHWSDSGTDSDGKDSPSVSISQSERRNRQRQKKYELENSQILGCSQLMSSQDHSDDEDDDVGQTTNDEDTAAVTVASASVSTPIRSHHQSDSTMVTSEMKSSEMSVMSGATKSGSRRARSRLFDTQMSEMLTVPKLVNEILAQTSSLSMSDHNRDLLSEKKEDESGSIVMRRSERRNGPMLLSPDQEATSETLLGLLTNNRWSQINVNDPDDFKDVTKLKKKNHHKYSTKQKSMVIKRRKKKVLLKSDDYCWDLDEVWVRSSHVNKPPMPYEMAKLPRMNPMPHYSKSEDYEWAQLHKHEYGRIGVGRAPMPPLLDIRYARPFEHHISLIKDRVIKVSLNDDQCEQPSITTRKKKKIKLKKKNRSQMSDDGMLGTWLKYVPPPPSAKSVRKWTHGTTQSKRQQRREKLLSKEDTTTITTTTTRTTQSVSVSNANMRGNSMIQSGSLFGNRSQSSPSTIGLLVSQTTKKKKNPKCYSPSKRFHRRFERTQIPSLMSLDGANVMAADTDDCDSTHHPTHHHRSDDDNRPPKQITKEKQEVSDISEDDSTSESSSFHQLSGRMPSPTFPSPSVNAGVFVSPPPSAYRQWIESPSQARKRLIQSRSLSIEKHQKMAIDDEMNGMHSSSKLKMFDPGGSLSITDAARHITLMDFGDHSPLRPKLQRRMEITHHHQSSSMTERMKLGISPLPMVKERDLSVMDADVSTYFCELHESGAHTLGIDEYDRDHDSEDDDDNSDPVGSPSMMISQPTPTMTQPQESADDDDYGITVIRKHNPRSMKKEEKIKLKKQLMNPKQIARSAECLLEGTRQNLTIFSIELVCDCRGDLQPDPRFDAVMIAVIAIAVDDRLVNTSIFMLKDSAIMDARQPGYLDSLIKSNNNKNGMNEEETRMKGDNGSDDDHKGDSSALSSDDTMIEQQMAVDPLNEGIKNDDDETASVDCEMADSVKIKGKKMDDDNDDRCEIPWDHLKHCFLKSSQIPRANFLRRKRERKKRRKQHQRYQRKSVAEIWQTKFSKELEILEFDSELELINALVRSVHFYDCDMIVGYEIQKQSLGYLLDRGSSLHMNDPYLSEQLGRLDVTGQSGCIIDERTADIRVNDSLSSKKTSKKENMMGSNTTIIGGDHRRHHSSSSMRKNNPKDEYEKRKQSGIKISGRIVINLWRYMRSEMKLSIYTRENVAFHLLNKKPKGRRIPKYSSIQLRDWFCPCDSTLSSSSSVITDSNERLVINKIRTLRYCVECAQLNLELMNEIDLVSRSSEMSRLIGIDFFSVLTRGSQFRVESLMTRICKRLGYLQLSPTRKEVANQPAMECLPLVMEPISGVYNDPICVLDFQSLYPSVMIAKNICFSTCLGRIRSESKDNSSLSPKNHHLGCQPHFIGADLQCLSGLNSDDVWVSPNGIIFVKSHIRNGVLSRMVQELLNSRLVCKSAIKNSKFGPFCSKLIQMLDSQQVSIKLTCNVTYGYTSAGFSGRMPCAEIADAIVQYGRQLLEESIEIIETHPSWNAKVVYGDTDSVFVLLKQRSMDEAFAIGHEIAQVITALNHAPIKLKFEKVYQSSVLLAKKRYVGLKYESEKEWKMSRRNRSDHHQSGQMDAKGIETIRRDSCSLVANMMDDVLNMLFNHHKCDLSLIKEYMLSKWYDILSLNMDHIPLHEYIFAKEVRLGTYRSLTSLPCSAVVSIQRMTHDPRLAPLYGQRVPYLVVCGGPKSRLRDLVLHPSDFILFHPNTDDDHSDAASVPLLRRRRRQSRNKGRQSSWRQINTMYYITKQVNPALSRILSLLHIDLDVWFDQLCSKPKLLHSSLLNFYDHYCSQQHTRESNKKLMHCYYTSKHCVMCDSTENVSRGQWICDDCKSDQSALYQRMFEQWNYFDCRMQICLDVCRQCSVRSHRFLSKSALPYHCHSLDCPNLMNASRLRLLSEAWRSLFDCCFLDSSKLDGKK